MNALFRLLVSKGTVRCIGFEFVMDTMFLQVTCFVLLPVCRCQMERPQMRCQEDPAQRMSHRERRSQKRTHQWVLQCNIYYCHHVRY